MRLTEDQAAAMEDLIEKIYQWCPYQRPHRKMKVLEIQPGACEETGIDLILEGYSWTDVDLDALAKEDMFLSHLSDEAVGFYLPALLVADLRSIASGRFEFNEILGHILFPAPWETSDYLRNRLALLEQWFRALPQGHQQALLGYFYFQFELDQWESVQEDAFRALCFYDSV